MVLKDGRDDSVDEVYIDAWLRPAFDSTGYPFVVFDELPEGWRYGIDDGRFGWGLRGNWDRESEYLWCENMPMYRNAYPGDYAMNEGYRQALVRRPR